jgi:hypothetical protein
MPGWVKTGSRHFVTHREPSRGTPGPPFAAGPRYAWRTANGRELVHGMTGLDKAKLRAAAAELRYWPATTDDEHLDKLRADPADHVHLPQLHRPAPLPALVIAAPPTAPPGRVNAPVAHQRPIHTRTAWHRIHTFALQLVDDARRTPARVGVPQHQHPRLQLRGHLMWTPMRTRRAVLQIQHRPLARVATQPGMHRLPRHPITAGNSADHRPVQDLQHRPITHLGHPQLPQHAGSFRSPHDHERSHSSAAATNQV